MGVSTFTPLFAITSGVGPLRLPTDPAAYGGIVPPMETPQNESVYLHAGHGPHRSESSRGPASRLWAAADDPDGPSGAGRGPAAASPEYLLTFSNGRPHEKEWRLVEGGQFVIGDSERADILVSGNMISRRHARISMVDGRAFIEDLGSTSGTYVNGRKIRSKTELTPGTRIMIGTVTVHLSEAPAAIEHVVPPIEPSDSGVHPKAPPAPEPDHSSFMSGSLEEVAIPGLLQFMSMEQKTGLLTVRSDESVGKIYLRSGLAYFSSIDDNKALDPEKAIYRILRWTTGSFDFTPREEIQVENQMQSSTDWILMEAMRQLDEILRVSDQVPPLNARLRFPDKFPKRLRDLPPELLDLVEVILTHNLSEGVTVAQLLDEYPGSDLDAFTHLGPLLKSGYVVCEGYSAGAQAEETAPTTGAAAEKDPFADWGEGDD